MNVSDTALKSQLTRLASTYPKGSAERRKLLAVITGADFDPKQIGEVEHGALEEGTPEQTYQGEQFTQQEFSELGKKQEDGDLGMKVDDTEAKLPTGQQEDQKVATDKDAGCEKLPEGAMRDNCEKKKEEGAKNDEKEDKKAAMPDEDRRVRDGLIRLAKKNPEFRDQVLPLVVAYDKARKVMAAADDEEDAKEAAKAVAKKAIELGYTKVEAVAMGKKAYDARGSVQ